jgi:hypothetical protein
MREQKHNVKQRVWFFSWLKWVSLVLFLLLLLCVLLKCCNQRNQPVVDDVIIDYREPIPSPVANRWIDNPNQRPSIDTNYIGFIPDDPLRRRGVNNLLNVYLEDTTSIEGFVARVQNSYPEDSITVNYYADEYKRVQFKINEARIGNFKVLLKEEFSEVKFVCS